MITAAASFFDPSINPNVALDQATFPATFPWPSISVVVPVRNEAACIERTLKHLVRQRYMPDLVEILVADGQSTDATAELVRAFSKQHSHIKLLVNPG